MLTMLTVLSIQAVSGVKPDWHMPLLEKEATSAQPAIRTARSMFDDGLALSASTPIAACRLSVRLKSHGSAMAWPV